MTKSRYIGPTPLNIDKEKASHDWPSLEIIEVGDKVEIYREETISQKERKIETYKNLDGNSEVVSFEIEDESIIVHFKKGQWKNYSYSYGKAGKVNIDKMKMLARSGRGLHSFIRRNVKDKYDSKW